MITVNFVTPEGETIQADGVAGTNVMEVARVKGIDGILGDCGGGLACATCHVHVDAAWLDATGTASADEVEMLEMAVDPDETSRLSCQIKLEPALDGLIVRIPEAQF